MYKVPNELKLLEIIEPTLISWVMELTDQKSEEIVEYFYQAQEVSHPRYFWQTPDESFSLVGIGSCLSFVAQSYEEMEYHRNNLAKQVIINDHHIGTGPVFLGGFPFDEMVNSEEEWQQLGNGYLFLPNIMMTEFKNRRYLTFNMMVTSCEEITTKWQILTEAWEKILRQPVKELNKRCDISFSEANVPEWLQTVEKSIEEIKSVSPIEKIVLARQLFVKSNAKLSVNEMVKNSLIQQTNTYCFALALEDVAFVGATPERLLALRGSDISTACVAGSIPRGMTKEEDNQLGQQLLDDVKNQHEHQIVVNSIERDMKKITDSLSSKATPTLLKNRDIQHLFFPFSGKKRSDISFFEAIKQLHPTPALGGEPKDLTTRWIRENELINRGMYGAPIGWYSIIEEEGEFAVGIRSALVSDEEAILYAGCGIVSDSVPVEELKETRVKFQPMLRAIGGDDSVTSN